MTAVSINSDDENVKDKMDCTILNTVLLLTILLFLMTIICYHYAKNRSKQQKY